jgi:CubicO group peptidase (beta-lactamase class C family)
LDEYAYQQHFERLAMTSTTFALKPPLAWRAAADRVARLWQRCTRRRLPAAESLGELDTHLLRDIQAPGRVHGQALEHSELARFDRQQAHQATHQKI